MRGAVEQPRDGEACGHWLGKLTEHLVSERLVVARGATSRLEGRYRLPLPAALADLAARVNDYLELLVRDELTRGLGVGHAAEHAGAQYPPGGMGLHSATAMEHVASTVSAVPHITVEPSFTGMMTMPPSATAR